MSEQETIERGALAYVNFVRAEKGFPLVASLDGFRPEDRAGYIAHVTAVFAALRPGDALPGGMVVVSSDEYTAIKRVAAEAYWNLAWRWQSHLFKGAAPVNMAVFAPECSRLMTASDLALFNALSALPADPAKKGGA